MSMYGGGPRLVVVCTAAEDCAKQSERDACDINKILRRYAKDGMLTHLAKGRPSYLDVSEVGDYRAAVDRIRAANEFFAGLPAKVRTHFRNDPAEYLDRAGSLSDEELKALGLRELGRDPAKEEAAPGGAAS